MKLKIRNEEQRNEEQRNEEMKYSFVSASRELWDLQGCLFLNYHFLYNIPFIYFGMTSRAYQQ